MRQIIGSILGFISFGILMLTYMCIMFDTTISTDTETLLNMGIVGFVGFIVSLYLVFVASPRPQLYYDDIIRDAIVLSKVEGWLEEEVYDGAQVKEAIDNNDECVTSDNTDGIIYGRHECAEGLLNQIKNWRSDLCK